MQTQIRLLLNRSSLIRVCTVVIPHVVLTHCRIEISIYSFLFDFFYPNWLSFSDISDNYVAKFFFSIFWIITVDGA